MVWRSFLKSKLEKLENRRVLRSFLESKLEELENTSVFLDPLTWAETSPDVVIDWAETSPDNIIDHIVFVYCLEVRIVILMI